MKQKITLVAGALALAGGAVIAAAATSQASGTEHGASVSTPTPQATVVFSQPSVSDSHHVTAFGDFGSGRKPPRA
ncbi:hypothetical protein [Streptomyces sp. NPDC089919]|uniref:hypothetical protein n=1 Tax=Streptomyces sp. NPDC089919 TaxID=3155188 RepID=UPI00344A7BE6